MSRAALILTALSGLLFLALAIPFPRAAAGGWLIAFVALGSAPLGALAWRLIGRLTGGAWVETAGLATLSGITPSVLIAVLPLIATGALIYPWAASAAPALAYLSPLGWGVRSLVVLGGLAVVALLFERRLTRLFAGLALLFYGASTLPMATDWLFSLRPGWISSNGGMVLAVEQLGTALAAALLIGVEDERRRRDLMGLLVATLLGALYLDLMGYIVVWYGDQADKTSFYRLRGGPIWPLVMAVIVGAGRLAPIGLIALHKRFNDQGRGAAALALLGFWLEVVWMVAPETGPLSALAAVLAGAAAIAAFVSWRSRRQQPAPTGRLAHG